MDYQSRLIPITQVSTLDNDDSVSEFKRCGTTVVKAAFLPVTPYTTQRNYHLESRSRSGPQLKTSA